MSAKAGFGLCCGSIAQADLDDFATAAAHAGFDAISIWPTLYTKALESGSSPVDMKTRLDDLGVRVIELDPLCSWLPVEIDPASMTARFASYSVDAFFEMAEVLGCGALNVIRADDQALDDEVVIDHLGALADRARDNGLRIQLEFLPWSPIADLTHASRIVRAVGRDNCGVHIDVWHHVRTGGTTDELAALDPTIVAAVQLSDLELAPWDDLVAETMSGRRLPGEGDGTAARAVAALIEAGVDAPMNLEVFSADLMRMSPHDAAAALAASTTAIVAPPG